MEELKKLVNDNFKETSDLFESAAKTYENVQLNLDGGTMNFSTNKCIIKREDVEMLRRKNKEDAEKLNTGRQELRSNNIRVDK